MEQQINVEYLGYVSAFLTTASFLPQAVQAFRTGDLRGISLSMYLMYVIGMAGWFAYGLLLGALPLILANSVTLLLASLILALKVRAVLQARPGR